MTRLILISLLLLSACTQHKINHTENWKLNTELSNISIITTKNNKTSEVSDFKTINGSINSSNHLSIEINLNSLETNIPIRNQRISEHLFHTDLYPAAEINTQLKPEDLTIGVHEISFDVDFHGVSSILKAEFMVVKQSGKLFITLHNPLIINARTFGLEDGIKTLRKIAKLQSIDFTVPIHLVLIFEQN